MCSPECVKFVEDVLRPDEILGKKIIEIGARYVNGTVRWAVEQHSPASYLGIDRSPGPCVDQICTIEDTFTQFEPESFDIVISTEMIEHVLDFRLAISALKRLCTKDGIIIITTRSKGFPLHGYPYDFWRFEKEDMEAIFSDFLIEKCIPDPSRLKGIFLKVKKQNFEREKDLSDYELYNILFDKVMMCEPDTLLEKVKNKFPSRTDKKTSYFDLFTELHDFGARRNTDKTTHNYLNKYEFFLKKFKDEEITLIELGVFKGSSVMMWYDYFKNAKIIGVDINRYCLKFKNDRIDIKILNLGDINTYKEFAFYKPQVIVDDASHLWKHQLLSFFELFKILPSGGIYIMENIQTSFEPLKPQFCEDIAISPYEVLQKISEAVTSNHATGRATSDYQIYIEAIAKHVEMITFIAKSCILIKK